MLKYSLIWTYGHKVIVLAIVLVLCGATVVVLLDIYFCLPGNQSLEETNQ